ncbi:hypothetical protein [Corynebacterium lowii]|uniref:Uncharacterized protein n=1 Tax=Corynebacterium lowii TaxID=1544413 RepID=A0A0Q0YKX7_9CORY|nr:hypothetical protein [Corynebacterium lowii]KQB87614.1 hypothetical protein Clow_00674 [Corynebacterium lowii]MDP9851789.1 hypothetical protein [Corynebacterium lowii]
MKPPPLLGVVALAAIALSLSSLIPIPALATGSTATVEGSSAANALYFIENLIPLASRLVPLL